MYVFSPHYWRVAEERNLIIRLLSDVIYTFTFHESQDHWNTQGHWRIMINLHFQGDDDLSVALLLSDMHVLQNMKVSVHCWAVTLNSIIDWLWSLIGLSFKRLRFFTPKPFVHMQVQLLKCCWGATKWNGKNYVFIFNLIFLKVGPLLWKVALVSHDLR